MLCGGIVPGWDVHICVVHIPDGALDRHGHGCFREFSSVMILLPDGAIAHRISGDFHRALRHLRRRLHVPRGLVCVFIQLLAWHILTGNISYGIFASSALAGQSLSRMSPLQQCDEINLSHSPAL